MSIVIVGGGADPQVVRMRDEVRARGGDAIHFDTVAFPGKGYLSLRYESVSAGREDLETARVVYVRGLACHPLMPSLEDELVTRPRGLVAQCDEKRAMLESLLLDWERRGARLVNGLEANAQHSRKPYQLQLLQAKGLPVPQWLATNDPGAVRAFVREMGKSVYKPLAGGASVRLVEKGDLSKKRLAALAAAPVLFQECVSGVSVRAFVVGRRVVAAAAIHSPELDYRRQEEGVEATRVSRDERRAAVAAARACGMRFTGVDLIRGPGGFKVLECNPSPMFAVFEEKTGLDVAGPLADYLLELARP